VIQSEPSRSRPRNVRISAMPLTPEPGQRPSSPPAPASNEKAWKVQLELLPEQIAQVYQGGLASGALVRQESSEEWQPLATTRELRPTLEASPKSAPPPPAVPPVSVPTPRLRGDSIPDWNDVPTGVFRRPAISATLAPTSAEAQHAARIPRARIVELSLAVATTMVLTLAVSFWVRGLSGAVAGHSAPAPTTSNVVVQSATMSATLVSATPAAVATTSEPAVAARPFIPVISVHDLPMENGPLPSGEITRVGTQGSSVGPERDGLAKALADAEHAAGQCGVGSGKAPAVVTFSPSGTVRYVRFLSTTPTGAARACALRVVARTRIAPFAGEAVTVSKTFHW